MDMELNEHTLEAIKEYNNIIKNWDAKRFIYPYTEDDFVTLLESIKSKEALYMFFKIYAKNIRNDEDLMNALGSRQLTNKYLRLMIMEFKLSNYFD